MNAEGGTRNAEQQRKPVPSRDLRERTKAFALGVIQLVQDLPRGRVADVIGHQVLRAGTAPDKQPCSSHLRTYPPEEAAGR